MRKFMRINKLVAPFLLLTAFSAQATNINQSEIPSAVLDGLKADHPDARNIAVTRQKHFGLTLYEVQFKLHGKPHEALFDPWGKPFGHEEPVQQLPDVVSNKLKQVFSEMAIESAVALHHPDGRIEYEIDLRSAGELWEVVTNEKGNILVKERI